MATFLLAWELGGGTGHCVNLLPLAKSFCEQGHTVFVAIRDVSIARKIIGDLESVPNSPQPFFCGGEQLPNGKVFLSAGIKEWLSGAEKFSTC